jgi:poly-beta-1,6-N-acetyl-D-glucosamine N-deacetylase
LNKFNSNNGIITLMYHRFEENKYPSTNIRNEIFLEHLNKISDAGLEFISFKKFENLLENSIDKSYLLLTIDDAFESFYENAWPILKKNKIPFVLFVSTREIGKFGYMNWDQIIEVEKSNLVTIGNHSHSHEYLVDWEDDKIKIDLVTSMKIFEENLGYTPKVFSYPFGEYSKNFRKIILDLGFKYAFGQHSGVIDKTKDFLALPRFPINEKYGELKRFNSILQTLPFPYESIEPENRYILEENNPPRIKIKFFKNLINVKNIKCYSNENNLWRESKINLINDNELIILIEDKFTTERGRINCSLREANGKWRWLGIQYVIAKYQ